MGNSGWHMIRTACAGGLTSLQRLWVNGKVGTQWADPQNPLGRFVYSSYTQADYQELFKSYMYIDPSEWWVSRDYGKYNVSSAQPRRLDVSPTAGQFWFKKVISIPSSDFTLQTIFSKNGVRFSTCIAIAQGVSKMPLLLGCFKIIATDGAL